MSDDAAPWIGSSRGMAGAASDTLGTSRAATASEETIAAVTRSRMLMILCSSLVSPYCVVYRLTNAARGAPADL